MFALVTGRPPRWMAPVAEATGHTGLAVCANGALLYDLHTETVVDATADRRRTRCRRSSRRCGRRCRASRFAVEYGAGLRPRAGVPAPLGRSAHRRPGRRRSRRSWTGRRPSCSPGTRRWRCDELLALARRGARRPRSRSPRSSSEALLEISAPGVTKASGLAGLAGRAGIAGRRGRRLRRHAQRPADAGLGRPRGGGGERPPRGARAADEVTASNDEDGVALVLERLVEGQLTGPATLSGTCGGGCSGCVRAGRARRGCTSRRRRPAGVDGGAAAVPGPPARTRPGRGLRGRGPRPVLGHEDRQRPVAVTGHRRPGGRPR